MVDNSVLQAPEWTMADAYGDIGSQRYEASVARLRVLQLQLAQAVKPCARKEILSLFCAYDEGVTISSSLLCFLRCLGSKDATDERVARENGRVYTLRAKLDIAAEPVIAAIAALPEDDPLFREELLVAWKFVLDAKRHDWHQKLSASDRAWLADFTAQVFIPLGDTFRLLQKEVRFPAVNSQGGTEEIHAAKMISVIKGDPDRDLRKSVNMGMRSSYGKRAPLYAQLLNTLHGFRLSAFERAGVTPLAVSLAQNRMSEGALRAMREAIQNRLEEVRDAIRLRAPFFGEKKLAVFDLMAPAPARSGKKSELPIPYPDGIALVRKAVGDVDPEISDFIGLMLDKHWVDAAPSDKKAGGAYYTRFNEFRQPRVFTSYMGSITSIIQQAHELGHAFHYWMIRDLPVVQTEFPMTLTETASMFNEALMRRYLLGHCTSDERFGMLWQELRCVANFLLNTMVRMDFELAFLREREQGIVNAQRCVALMRENWERWYGNTTQGADDYLWAYKLHYYKTDQLIYNYPYCVGYLLSQGLLTELDRRGKDFVPFYHAVLRDTGRSNLDEIIRRHFGRNASDPGFWNDCMKHPLLQVAAFGREFCHLCAPQSLQN